MALKKHTIAQCWKSNLHILILFLYKAWSAYWSNMTVQVPILFCIASLTWRDLPWAMLEWVASVWKLQRALIATCTPVAGEVIWIWHILLTEGLRVDDACTSLQCCRIPSFFSLLYETQSREYRWQELFSSQVSSPSGPLSAIQMCSESCWIVKEKSTRITNDGLNTKCFLLWKFQH